MDDVARKLNILDKDSWYSVTTSTLLEFGGEKLLSAYGYSLSALLQSVYPEYPLVRYGQEKNSWSACPYHITCISQMAFSIFSC